MAKMKVYIVHECEIWDYEERHDYRVYSFKENALRDLQNTKEQGFMPIVEEQGYKISSDTPTRFDAGFEYDYPRGSVSVHVIETVIEDYNKCD